MNDRMIRVLVATTEFARIPALWTALRDSHIPNRDGRCVGCRPSEDFRPYWPCRVRQLADRAHAVLAHR